jgi:manganese transport protein
MPPPPASVDAVAPPASAWSGTPRGVPVASRASWLRRMLAFAGPGYLVAVGYMDPGNWATDVAGGSAYGYALLWVVVLSSGMAMFLQVLASRLGIVAQRDLAQACRDWSPRRTVGWQWALCELAICACDLAEVIGTAIALNLLFGVPLAAGVLLTVLDVLLLLGLQQRGWRTLEAAVIALVAVVAACFAGSLVLADPRWSEVLGGLVPDRRIAVDPAMLTIAVGIIGATVMPHNLYLHSSVVQTRAFERDAAGMRQALRYAALDVVAALALAFLINAAILVTSGAVFHAHGRSDVAALGEAHALLGPLTGSGAAAVLFAVALLASGLSSCVTATLAGQVVMEGYLRLRMAPWKRRLLTRAVAIVPALGVTLAFGDGALTQLLLLSQVVLSLQLPFAMVPLVVFTSRRRVMGVHANKPWTVGLAAVIVGIIVTFNGVLLWRALCA